MSYKNAQETLKEYTQSLGSEFGSIFYYAHQEWCNLWIIWHQFENLFGRNKERVNLLNKTGGKFFACVDDVFFEATVLAVCRLSDPKQSMGKENLTVMKFIDFMDTPARKAKMQDLLNEVKTKTEFHRDWRNRRIGHNDLDLKISKAKPLIPATRRGMNEAIAALYDVFHYVSVEFRNSDTVDFVITDDGEKHMLYYLFDGVRAQEEHREAIRSGTYKHIGYPDWLQDERDDPLSASKLKGS